MGITPLIAQVREDSGKRLGAALRRRDALRHPVEYAVPDRSRNERHRNRPTFAEIVCCGGPIPSTNPTRQSAPLPLRRTVGRKFAATPPLTCATPRQIPEVLRRSAPTAAFSLGPMSLIGAMAPGMPGRRIGSKPNVVLPRRCAKQKRKRPARRQAVDLTGCGGRI